MDSFFSNFSKTSKITINALSDFLIIIFSLFISSKFFEYFLNINILNKNLIFIILIINFFLSFFFKIYFSVRRQISIYDLKIFLYKNILLFAILYFFFPGQIFYFIIFLLLYFFFIVCGSILIPIINDYELFKNYKKNTLIYGAGETGQLILKQIRKKNNILAYIDDDPNKVSRYINGYKIYSSDNLKFLVKKLNINSIYVAIPSLTSKNEELIFEKLAQLNVDIYLSNKTKELEDLIFEKIKSSFKSNVLPKKSPSYLHNKIILITGAAGSIGEEISFQIMNSNIKKIILIDSNETQLSWLKKNLTNKNVNKIPVSFYLCSLLDTNYLNEILEKEKPQIIFHAAAYKHVDLVEENYVYSIKNNIISLHNILNFSFKKHLEKFVFISSDKAVKPINIMGMSKRVGEIIVSSMNKIYKTDAFVSVRFGNVIGSSGSLFQIFKNQVENNMPLTITHRDTTRYFMTIYDAINLVINAPMVKSKASIYVLKMGEPIKILDIAKKFISHNSEKKLNIKYIGLRPGEKMHEELYNKNFLLKTDSKLIDGEKESITYSKKELNQFVNKIRRLNNQNKNEVKKLLKDFYKQ